MSQASDTLAALEAHEERLDQYEARIAGHDLDLQQVRKVIALLDRAQQTAESQIEVFRLSLNEESRRTKLAIQTEFTALREELKGLMNGHG